MRLEFGGADVTQAFHWLLKKCAFPYKEYDERNPQDAMLLKQLKEDFCHVNLVKKNHRHRIHFFAQKLIKWSCFSCIRMCVVQPKKSLLLIIAIK